VKSKTPWHLINFIILDYREIQSRRELQGSPANVIAYCDSNPEGAVDECSCARFNQQLGRYSRRR
jgi:hypothetical protein